MASKGVLCYALLAVGMFFAAPSSRRPPLDPTRSARLSRVEQPEGDQAQPAVELKSESGEACSGEPDQAKGVTNDSSSTLTIPPVDPPVFEKDRRQAVLSLIQYPWQDLGYSIVFMGSRIGYRAMTLTARHRIEVYVRPSEGLMHQAFDLAHELGHAFDLKYNDEERRRKWCELRGINPSKPWFGCDACPDYSTPAGDFAETFAYLLLGPGNYHSAMAPLPKPEQIADLAAFCNIEHVSNILLAHHGKKAGPAVQSAKAESKPETRDKSVDTPEPAKPEAVADSKESSSQAPAASNEEKPTQVQSAPADAPVATEAPAQQEKPDETQAQEPAPAPQPSPDPTI